MSNVRETIDWSNFDQYPEDSVTCVCGHTYRSHSKFVRVDDPEHGIVGAIIARKACGMCGGERMTASRSDPESYSV